MIKRDGAQCLRVIAALRKGLSSNPSTHSGWLVTISNSSCKDSDASGFLGHLFSHAQAHRYM